MTIQKLMADQKAAAIYASLDLHIPPQTLADNYLQAKLSGNVAECTALELFIRDLARMHFMRDDVRAALASMERHKSMRRPGTGAPKMLQEIADEIDILWSRQEFEDLGDGRIKFYILLNSEELGRDPFAREKTLTVSCKWAPGAVALLSAKYRRGMGKSRGARYGTINA